MIDFDVMKSSGLRHYGHEPIDLAFTDVLKSDESLYAEHGMYDHFDYVCYRDGQFHADVWVFGTYRGTVSAETVKELFDEINAEYGTRE